MPDVATHVALLRGINVGGSNKVAMADLRAVVASLGHTGVATYIQSGNVLFTTPEPDTAALAVGLEQAIAAAFGLRPAVIVLTSDELAQVVRANPYRPEPDPRRVHAVFLSQEPGPAGREAVAAAQRQAAAKGSRDTVTSSGRTLFLHTPDGFGRSELAARLTRAGGGVVGTARNWATVTRLLELCGD
jgi:uncharacterized protein (DUF1697 family)